ncbi:MAG: WD40 repeat domain-containing protein [Planctomycetaceae bacterium]
MRLSKNPCHLANANICAAALLVFTNIAVCPLLAESPPTLKVPANRLAFSPDGKMLASLRNGGKIHLWDIASRKEKWSAKSDGWGLASIAFSPDGKTLVSGTGDQEFQLWDTKTGKQRHKFHDTPPEALVCIIPSPRVLYSPNGKLIVTTGSRGRIITLWDAKTRRKLRTLANSGPLGCVAFSPDGKTLAVGSRGHNITLWDVQEGKISRRVQAENATKKEWVYSLGFSPDGKTLVSSSDQNTIKVWDVRSGKEKWRLSGHLDAVNCIAFSPGGKVLASCSDDGQIKIWDLKNGKEKRTIKVSCHCVVFSPDGKTLASGSLQYGIKLWDVSKILVRDSK